MLKHKGSVRGRSPALPPSSPPAIEYDGFVDQSAPHSPLRTSTQVEDLLSPEIARLQPPRTPASVRSKQRDSSSEYYTAAWGSPYERSPSSRSAHTAVSDQALSEDFLGSSSPGPEFGLGHLIPSRLAALDIRQPADPPFGSLSAKAYPDEAEDSESTPRSRAKRWVQLSQRQDQTDIAQWWSDKSDPNAPDRKAKSRSPESSVEVGANKQHPSQGHKSRESNRTLDQQSFWNKLREKRSSNMSSLYDSRWAATPPAEKDSVASPVQKESAARLSASRWAMTPPDDKTQEDEGVERLEEVMERLARSTTAEERIQPKEVEEEKIAYGRLTKASRGMDNLMENQPTSESDAPEKQLSSFAAKPKESMNSANVKVGDESQRLVANEPVKDATTSAKFVNIVQSSPTKSRLDAPRLKKKVSFRGKNLVIQLPNLDYEALGFAMPMSLGEASERLKQFEDEGYDTSGFDLSSEADVVDGPVHVKPIFPDESETHGMFTKDGANVRLPDLKKWAAYIDWLTEQKLAALGVSIGGEEPTTAGAQDMSRQSSGQYPPLPFSPPIPSNSTNSLGRPGMVGGHSHAMSVTSPLSPMNGPYGHIQRHSTFTGPLSFQHVQQAPQQPGLVGLRSFSPQGQVPTQQPAIPGRQSFSPQNQFSTQVFDRTARGPGSPFSQQMPPQPLQEFQRNPSERRPQQHNGYFPSFQQSQVAASFVSQNGNIQPTPLLPELPEEDDEEELRDRPGEAADLQPELPAYVPPHKRAEINANIAVPTPRGHRHNISEGFERDIREAEQRHQTDRRDWIEVDESSEEHQATDEGEKHSEAQQPHLQHESKTETKGDPLSQGHVAQEPVRSHKKNASRLNVAAPAFEFEPAASFQSAQTSFTFGAAQPNNNGRPSFRHGRQNSSGTFNVDAPVFQLSSTPSLPRSEFSFSAKVRSFKPDAPAFEPSETKGLNSVDQLPTIFGKVDIPDIVKPARRSKALPIVRPDNSSQSAGSGTEFEDEEGRLAQSDDRFKRQRQAGDDRDEVPQFAEPPPMPPPGGSVLRSPLEEADAQRALSPVESELVDIENEVAVQSEQTTNDVFEPPSPQGLIDSKAPTASHKHRPSVSLSALAKSFEPSGPSDSETYTAHERKESVYSISEMEEGELQEAGLTTTSTLKHDQPQLGFGEDERASTPIASQPPLEFDPPPSARVDTIAYGEPSFDEIDAVMRQLNQVDGDEDVSKATDVSPLSSPGTHPLKGVTYLPPWTRSDAPSPSPRRQQAQVQSQVDSSFTVHDHTDSGEPVVGGWPEPTRLNKADDLPASDWAGEFSPQDEEKLHQRGQFFDIHIDDLVGRAIERRLQPLEDSLRIIQNNVYRRPTSRDQAPKRSSSAIESDADDEDELSEEQDHRPISRSRDKRSDQMKAAVIEALREQSPRRKSQSSQDIHELHSILADMKMSFARAASAGLELQDVRAIVEDVVSKQSQALVPFTMDNGSQESSHNRKLSELEGRIKETLAGSLEEANFRLAAEEREAETKRMLRLAEEELHILRDSSRDADSRLNAAEQDREELLRRFENAEESQRNLGEQAENLEAENAATYATLEEYRTSSHKWRQDIDRATREREDLEHTMRGLERELEESHELGGCMRRRLEKLHSNVAIAVGQLADEKSSWKVQEEEYRSRCDHLEARLSRQGEERSLLEDELQTLRASAMELSEARLTLDQLKTSNLSLDETTRNLHTDLVEQQSLAARYERDFNDAREAGRMEVQQTRMSMGADIEAANHQVNTVRVELQSELKKVKAELENVKTEAETAQARHERLREEDNIAKSETLSKVNHANSVALDETRQKHETAIQELQSTHSRALQHALEDKQRSEHFLNERLMLSDDKLQHFQDKVLHLEERLQIAKSAVQAAAISAKSKAVSSELPTSALPEKVSPQALRESILVLQEQLQERELQIDRLENQRDEEGTAELKKRDDEISWLRELMTVRSEELIDLVNTLAQPTFDRASVRDAAIRIRANLQMEQQEKERFGQDSQSLPGQAITSLSNFATPKAVQLTSVFAKWRANMESSSLRNAPKAIERQRSNTPTKPSISSAIPPGYRSGLMTPPTSNLRNTPSPEATASLPPPQLHSRSGKEISLMLTQRPQLRSRQPSAASDAPTTPLLRSQSYDQDAADNNVHMESFEDEDLDVADNEPPAFRSLGDELESAVGDDNTA